MCYGTMVAFKEEEVIYMSFDHEDIMKRAKRNKRPPRAIKFKVIEGNWFMDSPIRINHAEVNRDLNKPFDDLEKEILSMCKDYC